MTWWQQLNATAKRLVVILPMVGLLGGWFVSFTTNIRVNAMALQRSIDAETRREERVTEIGKKVMAAEADAAVTKAATATAINRITLTQESQATINEETARQVKNNATQIAKTQEQLVRMSDLGNRIENLEKVSKKLSDEVIDLTRATTKLRKKVKEDPTP